MRVAVPTHTARRFSWRALAGAIVLAGTVSFGVLTPVITTAQTATGGYIGYDTPSFSAGQSVAVQTDDGGGLSLRFDASVDAERIGALQDGAVVRVVAGPYYDDYGNGWYLVTDGSLRAFAYAGFLVASGESAAVTVDEGAASSSSGYLGYPTPDFSSGQTVAVQTDDGGGLSLRLEPSTSGEKLAAAADGSTLTVIEGPYTDSAGNGWYLVTNGPLRAYAFAGFLVATSSSSSSDSSSGTSGSGATVNLGNETPQFSAGQSVTVQTDDGGGLSLRLEPSTSAEKLAAAKDGAALTIIEGPVYDDANNGWYLVTNGPLRAWAYAGYLVAGGSTASAGETSSSASSSSGNLGYETPQFAEGQGVIVQTDDGGGLSLRMEPTVAADKLAAMKDGANLTIVQGPVYDDSGNGWYLVTNGSIRAYAFAGFLAASGTASSAGNSNSSSAGNLGFDTPQFSEGQMVAVQTDTGGGLSLRMEPNTGSEQLMALKEGTTLTIVMGPEYDSAGNGWYLVTNGSIRAFAYAGFLVASTSASSSSASSSSASTATFSIGQYATTSGVTNVRNGATINGALLGTFSGDDIVKITDGPFYDRDKAPWYYIVGDSVQGFVSGQFLIAASAPASESTGFIYPLAKYTFSQDYGCSSLGFYSYNAAWGCAVHNGIDLSAPYGTPIMAAAAGTVVEAGWCDCGLGYYVKIDHGNGLATYYGHMQSMPYVSVGQAVAQGETIGPVGSTGLSTGPHTHFMVQKNGVTVDPMDYL